MSTYTITQVADNVRTWNTQAGAPMHSYRVTLRNEQQQELSNVELSRKATAPKPGVGETLDGTVDTSGQYGPKFKETRQGGPGGRSKPPEERRSIAMQHAQKCAVTVLELAASHSEFKPTSVNDLTKQVKIVAGALFQQVMEAESGQRVEQPKPSKRRPSDLPEPGPDEFKHPEDDGQGTPMEMLG